MENFIRQIEQKTFTQKAQVIKSLRKEGILNKPISIILSPKSNDLYQYRVANDSFKFSGKVINANIEEEINKNSEILTLIVNKVNEYTVDEFIKIFDSEEIIYGDLFLWYLVLYFIESRPEISLKVAKCEKLKNSDLFEMFKKYDRRIDPKILDSLNTEIKKITITNPKLIEDISGIDKIWACDYNFIFNGGETIFFCVLETLSILDIQERKEEHLKLINERIDYFVKKGVDINKKNSKAVGLVEHFLKRKESFMSFTGGVKNSFIDIFNILMDNGHRISREDIHKIRDAYSRNNTSGVSIEFNNALNKLEARAVNFTAEE